SLQNELLKNRETVKHINKWSYGVDITTTLKEYSDQEKKIIKTMAKNYKAISKHLSKCFKRNISNPNAIKVYENKNTGKITVKGYSKHKKGEIFFVSPETSNITKETTYQYKQNSR
ncbi:MAG: hypothetical protein GX944_02950, partial [Alphaproteobacteria bacterium]|nr:hypothetical protein [Alphaproteobacteria bacterium]